ncbi:MAG: DUF2399 domain-containing protein [Thermodesulfobacteriota bacterium]|nr:DUF2399 domain-containing protein [Thermodesulfobacteriota bacterium]
MTSLTTHLRLILIKICKRYERRNSLSGIMKLGQDLEEAERLPIENFFGLAPLIYTAKNEIKLSFDRLLSAKSKTEIDAWLERIYQLSDRKRPRQNSSDDDAATLLLDQLKLSFPSLSPIHYFLGRNRESLGRQLTQRSSQVRELYFTTATIVDFLLDNKKEITLSELGARFCANSKKLRQGELKKMVEQWLGLLCPDLPEEEEVWEEFLVIRDRLTISALIFAPLIYSKDGREYDWINQLYLAGEPALLSWFHLEGITSCRLTSENNKKITLITCENEAPFSQLLRERTDNVLLFTAGFPNRAVRRLYQLLAPLTAHCRHWGDSDPAGLRIGAILHLIHPLELWRCDLATLKRHKPQLLPIEKSQARAASSILNTDPDFPFTAELAFSLKHGWLEQESWLPDDPNVKP